MQAVHIGGKIRRLRQERRISQSQMATDLGISASYLNLIESNQRPVSARVLLKLADRFRVSLTDLSVEDDQRLESELMEVFSSPLFDRHEVKQSDVKDLVSRLPAVGRAVRDLFQRVNRPEPARGETEEEDVFNALLPSEEVSDFLQARMNHFPGLETAAEALWQGERIASATLFQDLSALAERRFGTRVEVVQAADLDGALRRHDPKRHRLMLSEMLPMASRVFQIAHQLAFLGYRAEIEAALDTHEFGTPEAGSLARVALASYFAAALVMPYRAFREVAVETRYDLTVLQRRFGASFEQVAHRLTTLRRPGFEGIPFHLIRVDVAGNISKRFSSSGIRIARFGAACPRWNVYDAFTTPGLLRVQLSRMPDGQTFFCVARTIEPVAGGETRGGLPHRVGTHAIGLGCALHHARGIVYADGLALDDPKAAMPIGVSCRTCPRETCSDRAMPSLAHKLVIDENVRGISTYEAV